MREERVARRYARALFQASLRAQTVDAVQDALQELLRRLHEQPPLQRLLQNPLIPRDRKQALVHEGIGRHSHPLVASLLRTLVGKRRERLLPSIAQEFTELYEEHQGLVRISATVAYPLDAQQEQALIRSLQQRTGKTVILETRTDSSLVGGIVLRIGDTIIDASISGQLQRLRQYLLNAWR